MNNNYDELVKQFNIISNQRWIKGINNFNNSVGLTFEKLLNKKADSLFLPDFHGIEIKCTQRYSKFPIALFSCSFDGPFLYEMNRLLITYGKNDIIYKDKKILNGILSYNYKTLINKYYFKLDVSNKNQKIIIEIYDLNNNLIENQSYISFDTLKTKLETKLSNLAIVYASKKEINHNPYFRYYKMMIYRLKSFDKFIELLAKDIIIVEISGRVSRSGTESGRQRNKNLVFKINKNKIDELFKIVKICDNDLNENFQII